ncbi:MAG: helix-turn-helix transcriptional regulator [Clostridiales bacterium]|nr:helix-turn-helix transcriptional regulator [Clostridiales bacterium]
MEWNEKVKALMKSKGINQKQLASLSRITESSISRYLAGDKSPRMDIIVNIAKALDVSPDFFLEDDQKSETPFEAIATAIARKGNELSPEEKNELIRLLLGKGENK